MKRGYQTTNGQAGQGEPPAPERPVGQSHTSGGETELNQQIRSAGGRKLRNEGKLGCRLNDAGPMHSSLLCRYGPPG